MDWTLDWTGLVNHGLVKHGVTLLSYINYYINYMQLILIIFTCRTLAS